MEMILQALLLSASLFVIWLLLEWAAWDNRYHHWKQYFTEVGPMPEDEAEERAKRLASAFLF